MVLPWPLPALLAWGTAWGLFAGLRGADAPFLIAAACGCGAGAALSLLAATPLRRWVVALGFPASALALGLQGVPGAIGAAFAAHNVSPYLPAWTWLLPLAVLALAYPMSAWRDAPLFPTPAGALDALAQQVPLPPQAAVLDAGCGLGHGLAALRRAYPQALLQGVERSGPIAWAARLMCRRPHVRATVRRGDMWRAGSWQGYAMVYLFQRPESMPRAIDKARAELAPGAWLASLEFPALDIAPKAVLNCPDGRPLWLYQMPFEPQRGELPAVSVTPRARGARRRL